MNEPLKVLSESYELEGLWWNVSEPSRKLAGTLTANPNELSLVVLAENADLGRNVQIIAGIVRGAEITLLSAVVEGSYRTGHGLRRTDYSIRYALAGIHATLDTSFDEITVSFSNIETSFCNHLIDHEATDTGLQFVIEKPIEKVIELNDSSLRLVNRVQGSYFGFSAAYQEMFEFEFQAPHPEEFDWFIEKAWDLRNLLTVLHGRMAIFRSLRLQTGDSQSIYLFFEQPHYKPHRDDVRADPFIPFWLLDEAIGASLFQRWFCDFQDKMLSVFLFCRLFYSSNEHSKMVLVLCCQMLEAFHRGFYGGEYMTKKEYAPHLEKMVKNIPPALDRSLSQRIEGALKFGYQYSQKKRFTDLSNKLPDSFRKKISGNMPLFITKVLDTRNFYTHGDEESKGDILKEEDVPIVNFALTTWFNLLMLLQLGVPEEFLLQHLENCHSFYMYDGFKGYLDFLDPVKR